MAGFDEILKKLDRGEREIDIMQMLKSKMRSFSHDLNQPRSGDGWTMLHWAVQNEYIHFLKLLLHYGADVNARDNFGTTPIMMAAYNGLFRDPKTQTNENSVLKLLIEGGFDHLEKREVYPNPEPNLSIVNNYKSSALHYAVLRDHMMISSYLCNVDPSIVNIQDSFGNTALHHACEKGNHDLILTLLDMDANVNLQNRTFEVALDLGMKNNMLELDTLEMMIEAHEDNPAKVRSVREIMDEVVKCQKKIRRIVKKPAVAAIANQVNPDGGWVPDFLKGEGPTQKMEQGPPTQVTTMGGGGIGI